MDESAHLTGKWRLNPNSPQPGGLKPADVSGTWRRFALATGILVLCFGVPFWNLAHFAATSEFRSYILLIPFISLYLVWLKRRSWPVSAKPARLAAGIFLLAGLATVAVYWLGLRSRLRLAEDDYLAVMMVAFLLCLFGVCGLFLGKETLRAAAFPLGVLIFMVPIPTIAMPLIDSFLQKGSAEAAAAFFWLWGTPFIQHGVTFQLPSFSLRIAPECSGIQSTMVLFITSLLAGYLFLRTRWKRVVLTLFMIPLALLRNGFRVFVVGELCVHIGPQMINSYIHRKGGPIFFALSLIPFFILLLVLQRSEKRRGKTDLKTSNTNHA